jgi:hypothetical protein
MDCHLTPQHNARYPSGVSLLLQIFVSTTMTFAALRGQDIKTKKRLLVIPKGTYPGLKLDKIFQ